MYLKTIISFLYCNMFINCCNILKYLSISIFNNLKQRNLYNNFINICTKYTK